MAIDAYVGAPPNAFSMNATEMMAFLAQCHPASG